jgi:protein SCO1/2
MTNVLLLMRMSLCCLLLAAGSGVTEDTTLRAGVFTPSRMAPDFSLQGSDGTELKLSRHRGKVIVLAFGFTSCPDVCPTTLGVLAQAHRMLRAQSKDLQVLYVTVDPQRDDAQRMRAYLAGFDPAFIGGTGTTEELKAIRDAYGILANRKDVGTGYVVAHSSYTYLIDRDGRLRGLMPYGHSAEDYVHDLKILMNKT